MFSSVVEGCRCAAWCSGCWRGTLLWKQQWWSLCGGERSPPGTKRGTESSPRLFSCPARLSNKPSLLFTPSHAESRASVSSCIFLSFSTSLHLFPLSVSVAVPPVYFSPSLSSQFHPFFHPTKTAIHSWHLESNKTFSENAKPAQKCHRSRDFCLKSCSHSPRQSYFVFLAH